MKGIQGLIIAIVLGLIGAAVNIVYLQKKASLSDSVSFVMVSPDKTVKKGQVFKRELLATFEIPASHAGNLEKIAYKHGSENEIIDERAMHDFEKGQVILQEDFRTAPSPELALKQGEIGVPIPVDTKRFIPSFIVPGKTQVSFLLPKNVPTPAGSDHGSAQPNSGGLEMVGPFDVISVGNRLGSLDPMERQNIRPVQENVLMIRETKDNKSLVDRLLEYLAATNGQSLAVVLHPESAQGHQE